MVRFSKMLNIEWRSFSRLLVAFCVCLPFACGKDQGDNVPDVLVDYQISVQEFNIKHKNNILLVDGRGVAGLILTNTSGSFHAFDRCSTVNPEKRCKVIPDESGLTATDTCSGAIFSLYDGAPSKAPAKRNLKEYLVQIVNGNTIRVTN